MKYEFCMKNNDQFFIGHDRDPKIGIMVIGFEKARKLAQEANEFFMDGTFKISQRDFPKRPNVNDNDY